MPLVLLLLIFIVAGVVDIIPTKVFSEATKWIDLVGFVAILGGNWVMAIRKWNGEGRNDGKQRT